MLHTRIFPESKEHLLEDNIKTTQVFNDNERDTNDENAFKNLSFSGNRILFVSDTHCGPDGFNGVQRTIERTKKVLESWGNDVHLLQADPRKSIPLPGHPEVRLSLLSPGKFRKILEEFRPHRIHIFTEGTIGFVARWVCKKLGFAFTTSYHTQWSAFLKENHPLIFKLLPDQGWPLIRWCHGAASKVMTRTESIRQVLLEKSFKNVVLWPGGVDPEVFHPSKPVKWNTLRDVDNNPVNISPEQKVLLYVGRVSREKNLQDLLTVDISDKKVVIVGDGPELRPLIEKYPDAVFLGTRLPEELAPIYSAATLFVHPGKHETFCLGAAEALMCDTRVAAYASTGLVNLIDHEMLGALDKSNLSKAIKKALALPKASGFRQNYAKKRYSTEVVTKQFMKNTVPSGVVKN